jgi:hypothetical protein
LLKALSRASRCLPISEARGDGRVTVIFGLKKNEN